MKIVLDNHIHTLASGHAYSTIKEIVDEAALKGLQGVSITDHGLQMPGTCSIMHFLSLPSLPSTIKGVQIFPGVELNILNDNGEVDLEERAIKRLTTVMAGIHPHCYAGDGTPEYNTRAYCNVMNNPYVKIIVHPGNPNYPFDIDKVVEHAAITSTALEINDKWSNPNSDYLPEGAYHMLEEIIKKCIEKNVYISFGSDSHFYNDVGDVNSSIALATKLGVPEALILNTSIEKYLNFISQEKTFCRL